MEYTYLGVYKTYYVAQEGIRTAQGRGTGGKKTNVDINTNSLQIDVYLDNNLHH